MDGWMTFCLTSSSSFPSSSTGVDPRPVRRVRVRVRVRVRIRVRVRVRVRVRI
jgi:hypothetical protein